MLIYMAFVAHRRSYAVRRYRNREGGVFLEAIEWQVVHKLTRVTISDGVRSFSITDFASAMAFLDIANTVGATSDRRPKVQE